MKIRTVGVELFHADGQTAMTKLMVAFRNFAISNVMKIRPVGVELFHGDGQTDMTHKWSLFAILRTHLKSLPKFFEV
jgi:hypothetical protein